MDEFILEMNNITKEFPGVKALDNVSVNFKKGEVHGICGENGAGKSTLMNILCGVFPDESFDGEILLRSSLEEKMKKQTFNKINDAEDKGIICIHQELALVPAMSVSENMYLGNAPTKHGIIKWENLFEQTLKMLDKIDEDIDPSAKIENLGVGQQQLVEIAKALAKDVKILILDEPTSALTEKECDVLFKIINELKENGITSIFISHKLDEILDITDRVTVLRDGKYVDTKNTSELDKKTIVYLMVGRKLDKRFPKVNHKKGKCRLKVDNFTVYETKKHKKKIIDNVSFEAYEGEILGIAGLMGSGRTELVASIFGAYPGSRTGKVYLDGTNINIENPNDAIKNGIAYVPEDRKETGLVLNMQVSENITMASLNKISDNYILNKEKEISFSKEYKDSLNIKTPSVDTIVDTLSGGNKQKVVLAKWILTDPKILILDDPTRGIDVGAKYEIYKLMNELVELGIVVIMISSELEEVLGMSDRVLVMHEGKMVCSYDIEECTQEKIMSSATGGV